MRAHGRDQFAAARGRRDACFRTSSITPTAALSRRRVRAAPAQNSISPRMARSVIRDMRLQPGKSASSSIHSWPIMVESMWPEKALAPDGRLHDNIDRQIAARARRRC